MKVANDAGMEVVEDEMSLHALFGTGPMEDDEELAGILSVFVLIF